MEVGSERWEVGGWRGVEEEVLDDWLHQLHTRAGVGDEHYIHTYTPELCTVW